MSEFGIGARLPRLEDERFLEGRGQFCADIALPGTLHATIRAQSARTRSDRKPQGSENRIFAEDLAGVGKLR